MDANQSRTELILNDTEMRELLQLISEERKPFADFAEADAQFAELKFQIQAIAEATGAPLEDVERAAATILNRRLPPEGAPTPVELLLAPRDATPSRHSDFPWLIFLLCLFGFLVIAAALAFLL